MRRAPLLSPFTAARLAKSSAVVFALAAAACTTDDANSYFGTTERVGKDVATFYVNNGAEPESLDPGKSADSASTVLIVQMFEGLTTRHPEDGHPIQGV